MSLLTPNPDRGSITIHVPEYIGTKYDWTGTPGQSTSTETVDGVVVRENIVTVPRPRAGVALGPWSASYPAGVALDEPGPDGVLGLMSITSDAGVATVRLTQSITGSEQTVYVSIQAWSSVAAQMPTPTIAALSGGSVAASVTLPAVDLPAGAWVEVSGELFVAGDFDEVRLIASTSVPAGESLDVTMGYVSTSPGDYFDGDTPDEVEIIFTGPSALWVSRQDINGEQLVRTLPGAPSSAPLTVEDYEHALTGPVKYYVNANLAVPYLLGTVDAGQVDWDASWLTVPLRPALSTPVGLVTGYSAELESRTAVHDIIGRPDPLPIIGPLGKRRGQLTYWLADYAGVRAVRQMYARGLVTMLRQPEPGLDLFHVLGDDRIIEEPHELRAGMPTRWSITVPFVEVERPTGSKQGSLGWSFDDLATSVSSFDLVTGTFATFYDLETGPTT